MSAQNMFSQEEQESDLEESDVDLDDVLAGAKRPRVSGLPKKELKTFKVRVLNLFTATKCFIKINRGYLFVKYLYFKIFI